MADYRSLSHARRECKYHVVFIAKGRRKRMYQHLRVHLGEVLRALARQRESEVEEGHVHPIVPAVVVTAQEVDAPDANFIVATGDLILIDISIVSSLRSRMISSLLSAAFSSRLRKDPAA